jgi:hypothetical protein
MAIKKLHDLPRVAYRDDTPIVGRAPDFKPRIGPKLMDSWYQARTHDDNLAHAIPEAGPFRGSWAGSCGRQIAYEIAKVPESEPKTVADYWRLDLGTLIHDRIQQAIPEAYPNAEVERNIDMNSIGIRGSLHLDMLLPFKDSDRWAAVEIKSINGFGYKMSATSMKGGPHGPRESAVIQGSLAAASLRAQGINVTDMIVQYLAIELVSPDLGKKIGRGDELARFEAEWTYEVEEFEAIAHAEAARWQEIDDILFGDDKDKPFTELNPVDVPRHIPNVGTIINPATSTARNAEGKAFKTWQCSYCSYRSRCELDGDPPATLVEL